MLKVGPILNIIVDAKLIRCLSCDLLRMSSGCNENNHSVRC